MTQNSSNLAMCHVTGPVYSLCNTNAVYIWVTPILVMIILRAVQIRLGLLDVTDGSRTQT